MRTLILTSPAMQGDDVLSMQKLLRGDKGPYIDFMQVHGAPVDGVWRDGSAGAARSAKYALGFPLSEVPEDLHLVTAGDMLRGYLQLAPASLPADYRSRRSARLNPPPVSMSNRALAEAKKHIGYHEGAGNDNMFGVWYGFNHVQWCAIFQTFCWVAVGSKSFLRGQRWAYVPQIVRDAMANRYGLSIIQEPRPGCLECFLWNGWGDEQSSHVGIVDTPAPGEPTISRANGWAGIEGNVSPLSRDAGGGVERIRHTVHDAALTYFVNVAT